ncbi:MAG TPA: hypothetical protein VH500_04045 [Nitrososphaeraceae archaeon]
MNRRKKKPGGPDDFGPLDLNNINVEIRCWYCRKCLGWTDSEERLRSTGLVACIPCATFHNKNVHLFNKEQDRLNKELR